MCSTANPRTIAGKIVSAHNRHECWACQRELPEGGVLAFGLSGSDARYYADRETAERHTPGVRYYFPHALDRDVDVDEVIAWLESQRDEIDAAVEYLETQRMERRVAREQREADSGFRTDPFPCADCAKNGVTHYKNRPADPCDRCGDEPCPIGIDPHNYNRGYGYRD
jgi:hypothetical protein